MTDRLFDVISLTLNLNLTILTLTLILTLTQLTLQYDMSTLPGLVTKVFTNATQAGSDDRLLSDVGCPS